MSKLFITIFFCSTIFIARSQSPNIDSLKQLVRIEKRDTVYISTCARIATAYFRNSQFDSAMRYCQRSMAMALALHDPYYTAKADLLKGNIYFATGIYNKALEAHLEALKIGEKTENEAIQSASLINASNVYAAMGEYDMSNNYAYKSLVLAQKNNNQKNVATNYVNISDNYFKMKMFDSARDFANKGYSMSVEMNNQENAGLAMNNLGNAYRGAGEWDLALACYRKANLILENSYAHPESTMGLAKVFQHQGNADSAVYYARHSFQEAVEMETTPDVLTAAVFLAEHYEKKNEVDSAYRYLNYVIAAKDSLFSQEKTSQLQALYYEEVSRQQKIEQARLEAEEERHNNIQYAVLAVGVIFFLVLILLLSRSVIVNEKWISFLGVLGLLLLFEFINLCIHPFLGDLTHHSPLLMYLALVVIAAFLIPLHHRVEHSILARLTLRNRSIRLEAARRTMKKLEKIDEDEKKEH